MSLVVFSQEFAHAAEPRPLPLRVMTFNLKFASNEGPHAWSARRPIVRDAILEEAPDVFGTQEGLHAQLTDLAADLPDYAWIGVGRNGGQQGEFSAIFYKKTRFTLLDHGNFWLSSTPEVVGSRTWGNLLPRMATWGLFEEKESGRRFYHFNTHFDHLVSYSRTKSAELLVRRIAGRKLPEPVVVTGDFNTDQRSAARAVLAPENSTDAILFDTWSAAVAREGQQLSTFHNWKGPRNGGKHIDWILATREFKCKKSRVVTFQVGGAWPSDHFPVVSDLLMGENAAAKPLIAQEITSVTKATF